MIASISHAINAAIHRAYALGRVDQAIGVAAAELLRMVAVEPDITPGEILRRYGEPVGIWSIPDWDHVLWRLADIWCDLQRELMGRPARQLPASPYSVLLYAIPVRDAAATR